MNLPENYNFKDSERKWVKFWGDNDIYRFNPKARGKTYSVDTPPPTVSGRMHLGHAFSYSQQDFVVRYRRMKGLNVFYPFGTDDNGLPTERMVERLKNVRSIDMPRDKFVRLCEKTIKEIKPDFVQDWKNIGMSCDFKTTYSTIDGHCRKTSQELFIDLFNKGLVYRRESPTMWCVECQTAIAQAELEDKELNSSFNDICFDVVGGKQIVIATTRPELLPACVCVFVHPNDKRYKGIVGKTARVPIFNQEVPIFADESADPDKGSGILMVCSYGDRFDVDAIQRKGLEPRVCITKDGRMNSLAGEYSGLGIKEARKRILEDLNKKGLLLNSRNIVHIVNTHDKCGTEIEFLMSKQWFIKLLENKDKLARAADRITWYPASMKSRYVHWVEGLQWDWCVSRQRHFGIPFPVWYCERCGRVIAAKESELPVDPFAVKKKCRCGGAGIPEQDVMDTWATSSLSPQVALNYAGDKGFDVSFKKMFPMSMRPQAHDIIRTWAFYTIVRGIYHFGKSPWDDIVISGHIQDPHGRKMSKSLGNVIELQAVLEKYGADALRFMAATSKLGEDMPYQEKDVAAGLKTVTKLWNASKFCISHLGDYKNYKGRLKPVDRWFLMKLSEAVRACTDELEAYEYAKTRAEFELFFWRVFCDNYLEIVKDRLYNPERRGADGRRSCQFALYNSLFAMLCLIAPIMPFITEEVYQLYFAERGGKKSIHICKWPKADKIDANLLRAGDKMLEAVAFVRQEKSKRQVSLKTPVKVLHCGKELKAFEDDLMAVTKADKIVYGSELRVEF